MVAASPPRRATRPPLGATLALTVVLAAGAFAALAALILIVDRPTTLPAPFPSQNQDAETATFLLTFAVVLPAALLAGVRLARRPAALAVAGLLTALLAAAVISIRLSGAIGTGDGVRALLAAAAVWWLLAGALLARPLPALERFAAATWVAAAVLGLGALLCLADLRSLSVPALIAGLLVAAAIVAAYERVRLPRLPRAAGIAVDAVLLLLLVLAVPDLVVFRPEQAPGHLSIAIENGIVRFHQNFLLGPANEVLHGGAMLVDAASQYGVGSIYLVAGWSKLLGIGYGTFGALDGGLTALWFAAGYLLLRLCGVSRLLAGTALAIGVVVLVLNLTYTVGQLPQYGPLRYGFPMAVLLPLVAAERHPARAGAARAVALVVAGLSALFSLEALVYTTVVYGAVVLLQAWLEPEGRRLRWLAAEAAKLVAAWVVAHVLFALLTLGAAGQLPDWGQYLDYLRAFLFGSLGDLTYDVPHWSPGLGVGLACLASAAAVLELARRRELVGSERTLLVALAGTTAYAIVLLSYWVDRSLDHILLHVSLPVLLLAALWLSVLLGSRDRLGLVPRRAILAFAAAVAVLVTAIAWSAVGEHFPRTALAHAVPGGSSLRGALTRLRHPPPLSADVGTGQALLERAMPDETRSLVLVSPDVGLEIELRARRVDELFLGDPLEASFVAGDRLPALRRVVAGLKPGRRMLLDAGAVKLLSELRADPSLEPLRTQGAALAPLQVWALRAIDRRFRLRRIAAAGGFSVWRLDPRP